MRTLVAAQQEGTAAGGTADEAASLASDVGSIEDLDDDEKWKKIEKGRRRTLLRRQKDELASKVRAKLGGATSVRSPFLKK